jgi:ribonucleotide monophosphatase NagD (HAD superfamily)
VSSDLFAFFTIIFLDGPAQCYTVGNEGDNEMARDFGFHAAINGEDFTRSVDYLAADLDWRCRYALGYVLGCEVRQRLEWM